MSSNRNVLRILDWGETQTPSAAGSTAVLGIHRAHRLLATGDLRAGDGEQVRAPLASHKRKGRGAHAASPDPRRKVPGAPRAAGRELHAWDTELEDPGHGSGSPEQLPGGQ